MSEPAGTAPGSQRTVVYTDGACLGNPGPGGWAWAVPGGRWRSGPERHTTNQRMEISAALDAACTLQGPLEIVSDSTYVVNCFQKDWWKKWVVNGWVSSSRLPVANRDLWEPLVELFREAPGRLRFRWVKGHSTDPYNDLVDRLAVAAANAQQASEGDRPPPAKAAGPADNPGPALRGPALARQALARVGGLPATTSTAAGDPRLGEQARLRSARPEDAVAVVALWEASGMRPAPGEDVAAVAALVSQYPGAAVLAEVGDELVGSVIAGYDGWRATLYRLAVHPDWRRQRLATRLVTEAERRLQARGAGRVGATAVDGDSEAAAFWESCGYRPEDQARRYCRDLSRG